MALLLLISMLSFMHVFCFENGQELMTRETLQSNGNFLPVGLSQRISPASSTTTFHTLELNSSFPFATIDYGGEVSGYPSGTVESFTGKVQIEFKYSEEFAGQVNSPFGDGPFPFAQGLNNAYRKATVEVFQPGYFESYLIQGGFRWQTVRLLTNGTVKITFAVKQTHPHVSAVDMPGQFSSDNALLNNIWKLGANAVDASCFEANTATRTWLTSPSDGVLVRYMRPQLTYKGANFKSYTLDFYTKIFRGGAGWAMAYNLTSQFGGLQFNLVGELPPNTTFVNTNRTITPPNSIILGYGYTFVNQTTLPSYYLEKFSVPFQVHENTWYHVRASLAQDAHLSVQINDITVVNVSLTKYSPVIGHPISVQGSFGFGVWQDQYAYFKNVTAYDSDSLALLYNNSMTDDSVLAEYGVHPNFRSACVAGPKRDRLVWLGDFYHTTRIVAASTTRYDILKDELQGFLDWQRPNGLLPFAPPMGYDPTTASDAFALDGTLEKYGLIFTDYQILGLLAFCNYVKLSNDIQFASLTWSQWKNQINWLLATINPTTGLVELPGATFLDSGFPSLPNKGGSAQSCAMLEALNRVAEVATAIGRSQSATTYQTAARALAAAINTHLWNANGGFYSLSQTYPNDFSVAGQAFCIISGAANSTQAARSLSAASNLYLSPGFKDSTHINSQDRTVNISPFTNGFLLHALLLQDTLNATTTAQRLLESLWGSMINDTLTTTGASWEYVSQTKKPGLGAFTSLAHPWAGAPTYLLTEYAAGLRINPDSGASAFGYKQYLVDPSVGLKMGLKNATASVITGTGGTLKVQWSVTNGNLSVVVNAPLGHIGVFQVDTSLGITLRSLRGMTLYSFTVQL